MRKLVVLIALALPVLIMITLPASLALRLAGLDHLPLRGVSGTPWHGQAQWLHPGRPASALEWRWRFPWQWQWSLRGDGLDVHGGLHPGRSALRLAPVDGSIAMDWLDMAQWLPYTRPHGQLELNLHQVTLADGWVHTLDGTATWRAARLSGALEEDLGEVDLGLESDNGGVRVNLQAAGPGALGLRGQVRLERETYEADLWLRAAPDRPELARQLARMGKVQADGQVRVQHQGWLLPPAEPR